MAKKISVKLILELRGNGMGRNAIARTRHISVNSVGDVFHKADENGISYEDVRDMDEDSVYRMFYPDKFVQESMYAQPDYGYVHQELKRVGVTLKLLFIISRQDDLPFPGMGHDACLQVVADEACGHTAKVLVHMDMGADEGIHLHVPAGLYIGILAVWQSRHEHRIPKT